MTDSKNEKPNGNGANGAGVTPKVTSVTVGERKRQLIISSRSGVGNVQPMSADSLQTALDAIPGVKVLKKLKPQGLGVLSTGGAGGISSEVVVAEAPLEQAIALQRSAPPNLIVENNALLRHADEMPGTLELMRAAVEANMTFATGNPVNLQFRVQSDSGEPVPDATVIVYGSAFPAQGKTDGAGMTNVTLFGGPPASIQALYVKPANNHWERFVTRPQLDETGINIVALTKFSSTMANFPAAGITGWGLKLMGIDQLPQQATGRTVKVAIVDSGCDNSHPQLRHVVNGVDLTNNRDSQSWAKDEIFHGTHCAGVIGARSDVVQGIRGIAPSVEIIPIKVFPGGRFDDLITALDECIARQVDVVNLSLGSDQPSEIVTRKILEARQNGVACIIAAGNSSGPVQFPGTAPGVLTVAAIGKLGEFPQDTNHAQTVIGNLLTPSGLFPAKFSCHGPEISVCAPGVAVLSTVPGGYAAWDGTSMATPHVTGLAALILSRHAVFENLTQHNEQRVDALFQILRQSAVPAISDPSRNGAGVPVFNQQSAVLSPQPQSFAPLSAASAMPSWQGSLGTGQIAPQAIPSGYYVHPAVMQMIAQMRMAGMLQ